MDAASKSGRKRTKGYYGAKQAKKRRVGHLTELKAGMQGVLITTGDQEKLCVSEAYSLLNEYADQLYGVEACLKGQDSGEASDEDIASAVAREVEQLKGGGASGGGREQRRFQSVMTGAKHVVFIQCREPVDPCALVHHMLTQLLAGGVRRSRFCQRVLPVVKVCHASLDDIKKLADGVLKDHFHASNQQKCKFAVHYKARNNNELKREDVIKLLAAMVTKDGEFPHPVDLSHPELTVVAEVVKNLCCMSVVRDFNKLGKYNINNVVADDSKEKPAATAAPTSDTSSTLQAKVDKEEGKLKGCADGSDESAGFHVDQERVTKCDAADVCEDSESVGTVTVSND